MGLDVEVGQDSAWTLAGTVESPNGPEPKCGSRIICSLWGRLPALCYVVTVSAVRAPFI